MPLISKSIPNLFNGVSQQPASLRHISQCESQVNAYPSIVEGLKKRPPIEHIAKVYTGSASSAFTHVINRDTAERYEVIIFNGDLKVYDLLDGTEVTVNFPNGKGYLTAAAPNTSFALVTVADYTFVVNKTVTIAMSGVLSGGSLTGSVQKFSDLPGSPTIGNVYEIAGDPSNNFDNYYVQYQTGNVWREVPLPNIDNTLDATTMPHTLVRNAGGDFTFDKVTWIDRSVGDTVSAPVPSFVGLKLSDVFFHRNRLGFTADENVVFSTAADFFNFWPETVIDILDADPVDTAVSHTKVSLINHAIPFDKSLLLFSEQTQFMLSADKILTPSSPEINPTTEFESSKDARPVSAGRNVFFVVEKGTYAGLKEYFVEEDTVTNDASDITAHVPNYIPSGVFKLSASSNEDILLALTLNERNAIYVYKFYWAGNKKQQSSWSKWTINTGDIVLDANIIGTTVYLLVERNSEVFLEKMELQAGNTDGNLGFLVHLDRKQSLTGVYDAPSDTTTWTLPYSDTTDYQVVFGDAFTGNAGGTITTAHPTATTITATGDYSAGICYVGTNYEMRYRFSPQFVRETKGESEIAITTGVLKLGHMSLNYTDTGYFEVQVQPSYRNLYTYRFTGKIVGSGSFKVGEPTIETGTFRFPVQAQSDSVDIDIVNDTYMPCFFQSAEWQGRYTIKSRRI